jgi:hypothetical protein
MYTKMPRVRASDKHDQAGFSFKVFILTTDADVAYQTAGSETSNKHLFQKCGEYID